MAAAVAIRTDYSASQLRRLAAGSKHANQARRLLSLAAVLDGASREEAARIGGMDRQTLRDWVHRFNAEGPDGLKDIRSKGHPPRLTPAQLASFAEIVETGPDRAKDGVVRWRRIDLKLTLIWLPSRSPELNPVENIWQYLRGNWLSNTVFETYDDIIDAACEAWNKLTTSPDVIASIGLRDWAHIGQ